MYYEGKLKVNYNHWDSYPAFLGIKILEAVRDFDVNVMKVNFDKIEMVKEESPIPKSLLKRYKKYTNTSVGGLSTNKKVNTWYQLLRELQGEIESYLTGEVNHMIDSSEFMKDSLFCEWAYVINLDDKTLEVYEGYQKKPHGKNKYFNGNDSGDKSYADDEKYYPVKLIKTFKLNKLPTPSEFLSQTDNEDFKRQEEMFLDNDKGIKDFNKWLVRRI